MFIYNFKINGSKVFKYFFIGIVFLVICIVVVVCFKIFNGAGSISSQDSSCLPKNTYASKIPASNYTNVLKTVHDNIDNYVNVKINFTGYVHRVLDLNENQFVLARDMVVSSDYQTVIVGFLCECDNAKDFVDNSWVEVTGIITKGNYHGDMPIVKVTEIKEVSKPNDEYVYPPDESYIPTNNLL